MSKSDRNIESLTNETLKIQKERFLSCPIHLETLEDPVQGPCGHVFCRKCIVECLKRKELCPLCQIPIKPSQLYSTLVIKQILEESRQNSNKKINTRSFDPIKYFRDLLHQYKEKARINRWDLKAIIIILSIIGYLILFRKSLGDEKYVPLDEVAIMVWTFILIIFLNYTFKN